MKKPMEPLEVFFSYSHKDEKFKNQLEVHLKILQRQGLIKSWHDRMIVPGKEWASEIDKNLESADIILILVSADFIASDYCYEKELSTAIRKHNLGEVVVIPVFVRACDWAEAPFAKLQGLPKDAKPIASWSDQDEAWTDVANSLRRVIQSFSSSNTKLIVDKSNLPERSTDISTNDYFKDLIQKYEVASWTKRAITLYAKDENSQVLPINTALWDWIKTSSSSTAFLIGEFGSGKTWVLKQFAKELAELYLIGQYSEFIPVFIPLVKVLHSSENSKIIIDSLIPSLTERNKKFLFLFDGLDEVSFQAKDNVANIIDGLLKKTPSDSRHIISCRTQAFSAMKSISEIQLKSTNSLTEDKTEWAIQTIFNRPKIYEICRIKELEAEQFLKLGPAAQDWENLQNKKSYRKIIGQPVVLALLEKALPEIHHYQNALTVADIYRLSLEVWFKRDAHCNNLNIPTNIWMNILAELADLMFPGGSVNLEHANQHFHSQSSWDSVLAATLNAEILETNDYKSLRFSHQSIWEFFFATQIHQELKNYNARLLARSNLIYQYATNCFLVPLLIQDTSSTKASRSLIKSILDLAEPIGSNGLLSKLITNIEFQQFTIESHWRQNTGYGMWGTFDTPDGTPMMVGKKAYIKGLGEVPFSIRPDVTTSTSLNAVSGISWYDAWQFCSWVGGVLPHLSVIKNRKLLNTIIELEWTQDWHDEQNALIAVYDNKSNEIAGLNPDIRAENLGFRVFFPNQNGS